MTPLRRPRLVPALRALPAYEPAEGLYSATPPRPLSANESAYGPLPDVVDAVERAARTVNRYPDPGCRTLTRALAEAHGLPEDRFVVGAGTVALLQVLFQAVGEPGAEAVFAWPSFELYPVLAQLAGVLPVPVPLVDEAHDLREMADRITSQTRLVVVCNPNNPTGTVCSAEEIDGLLSRVPPDCLVVFDEAYFEYVREPGIRSGLDWCADHPNAAVLRTFSKAYGLAGLRVGYLVAAAEIAGELRKGVLPYSVSGVAQAAAVASLASAEQLSVRVDATVMERTRVRDALGRAGWDVPESQTNFLWLPLGEEADSLGRWCTRRSIAVRTFPGQGVRVTVGSSDDDDAFLAVASDWREQPSARTEDAGFSTHERTAAGA